ncbi:hypothetical protein [Streptomyces sp. NBC_00198]|uniref:hypothetical protein n=1 Tax=Streptomyces sp. NBC_00198 TaxID=2975677 RepID=UPI00225B9FF7|nr:hypothetical protein [Streptomyces sp. NBC_00198]MCX5282993.1 hypothetical protein [Streptomyces sp. NBC_00198]
MTERMKPPARRTAGRTLGGAKKTAPPPPPPSAELTPEQFAAEQAAQGEGRPAASAPRVQPAPSIAPVEASAQGPTETATEVTQTAAQLTVGVAPTSSGQGPVPSQPIRPAVVASEVENGSAEEPVGRQVPRTVPAVEPAAPAGQPARPARPVAQHGPSPVPSTASAAAPTAEVAIRPAVSPMAGGTAFPVRTDGPSSHQGEDARAHEAPPSEGTPYAHGPGRPKDIPEASVVLNQRIIARESLDSSVPAALKLKKRIKRFALDNELDHLPIGDIVSVALDEWLTARGF